MFLEISDIKQIRTIIIQIGKKVLEFRNMQEKLEKFQKFDETIFKILEITSTGHTKVNIKFFWCLGPHFLCWILEVVPLNTWLILSWKENNCCYKLSKCYKLHLFHAKFSDLEDPGWPKLSFWVKKVVILWIFSAL